MLLLVVCWRMRMSMYSASGWVVPIYTWWCGVVDVDVDVVGGVLETGRYGATRVEYSSR